MLRVLLPEQPKQGQPKLELRELQPGALRSGALRSGVRQPQAGREQQRAPALERRAFQPGQLQARRPGQPWVLQPELPQERPQGPREQQLVRGQLRLALQEWPEPQA